VAEISTIIARFTKVEDVYIRDRSAHLEKDFELCLIGLHAQILEYQVRLVGFLERSTVSRFARAISQQDQLSGLLEKVRLKDATCRHFTQIFDSKDARSRHSEVLQILRHQDKAMEDCAEEVMKLTYDYENYSRKQILQWISGIVPGNTHDNILEQGRLGSDYAKTGRWLARHPLYLQWIASQGWCIEKQGFFQDGRNRTWKPTGLLSTASPPRQTKCADYLVTRQSDVEKRL
jgi:hypothetical protein